MTFIQQAIIHPYIRPVAIAPYVRTFINREISAYMHACMLMCSARKEGLVSVGSLGQGAVVCAIKIKGIALDRVMPLSYQAHGAILLA